MADEKPSKRRRAYPSSSGDSVYIPPVNLDVKGWVKWNLETGKKWDLYYATIVSPKTAREISKKYGATVEGARYVFSFGDAAINRRNYKGNDGVVAFVAKEHGIIQLSRELQKPCYLDELESRVQDADTVAAKALEEPKSEQGIKRTPPYSTQVSKPKN